MRTLLKRPWLTTITLLSVSVALQHGWASARSSAASQHDVDIHPAAPVHVTVEYSKASDCEGFARQSKIVIEEWYPKINEILFGVEHPLPSNAVSLVCKPMKPIAYSDIQKNRINISAEYVRAHPEDYGMVVHELTHIVQHYAKLKREEVWLQEGIADYVRHKYFEHDVQNLSAEIDQNRDSYRTGYRVTAAFLAWLEQNKNAAVVHELNRGCAEGHCTVELFRRACGKDVDALWSEFLASLKRSEFSFHSENERRGPTLIQCAGSRMASFDKS